MNILNRLFGRKLDPIPNSVTVTTQAAEAVRRIASEQRLRLDQIALVIGQQSTGYFTLDLSEDQQFQMPPRYSASISNGLIVSIPSSKVAAFADLTIHHVNGGFKFSGSAAPPEAFASHPGRIPLSVERLIALRPELTADRDAQDRIAHYLDQGDSSAAMVVQLEPLVVASYSDELKAVALLMFPQWLVDRYRLQLGIQLLSVNTYRRDDTDASDVVIGATSRRAWTNFNPHIADFLSDDATSIRQRKAELNPQEWAILPALAKEALGRAAGRYRDRRPPGCDTPAY